MEKSISPFYFVVLAFSLVLTWMIPYRSLQETKRFLSPPPEHLEQFHFGFADSVADSLWLRWIQDGDYCQTYAGAVPAAPIQPVKGEFENPRHRNCDNSWAFKMLDAITKVAPKFRMPYATGGISLSVLVEDYEGASVIFDRAIERFPNDWDILYQASYHFLFDRHELTKAADLLLRAAKAGGPGWFTLLAARLYSKEGQIEMGIRTLERYRATLTDERLIKDVEKRIKALKDQVNQ